MMINLPSIAIAACLIGSTAFMSSAVAQQVDANAEVMVAQDACQVAGQRVASERGATLLAASAQQADGQTVCEVVILIPASDGGRQRREVVVVPL